MKEKLALVLKPAVRHVLAVSEVHTSHFQRVNLQLVTLREVHFYQSENPETC